ncbi:MAG: adenylate/guanylate cyclase domain-containing protein [Nitrosopumilus sp.]|nr:adenylate/guanylate cyclase domain-containing protein [Nitrosopumilus sp.]MDH3515249.1 adenylate/guanylate cyclase domain-containing protein [Nitrosopumilus sp.]MDH3564450.1 adenylate/guanylate cyclase domain-containing protein [Nitrosopumilus sp.]MDH5417259.1 adenylate/guanylate cyclase domain-containing protein [Nitrosopumilus sp.]MDH5554341.1 adenylate/guanylate cyclase domain-containing protein [Nitrosopumilus sp.]
MTENKEDIKYSQKSDSSSMVDMLLSKNSQETLDSDTMILETQKRVWGALKKGYEYSGSINESEQFLRKNVFSKLDMVVLYVDLVGSTTMTLEMPEEKIAIIISSFSQEMAVVIRQYHGYVLKFVGDAVIGYFVTEENGLLAADNAVNCAKSMISVIQKGINPILNQYDYPDLMVKIGVDFGKNIVVRYGADVKNSHVDLMGPAMNIAAKIQNVAKPNQILIGNDVYQRIHPATRQEFSQIVWKNNEWKYRSRLTGEIYNIYEFKG